MRTASIILAAAFAVVAHATTHRTGEWPAGMEHIRGRCRAGGPDNPSNVPNHTPGIGNVSVIYSNELRLRLMTYDSVRGSPQTRRFYFTYAGEPWPGRASFTPKLNEAASRRAPRS